MQKLTHTTETLLHERFGKDSIISLATTNGLVPYVRQVDAYYEDSAFYVLTHALSGKIQQIAKNPQVAIAGEWFTAHGVAENLGWVGSPENAAIGGKMLQIFSEWINNGHTDLTDINSCILRIRLTQGILFSHGTRHEIDFT